MALGFTHYELEVSFIDKGLDTTTRTYKLDPAITVFADAATAAAALVTDIAAATLCAIQGYRLVNVVTEGALTIPTDNGARVSMDALISGRINDNPLKSASISIPGPVAAVFVATSGPNVDVVSPTATVVADFLANFLFGADFTISDGEQYDAASAGFSGIRRTKFKRLA